MAHKSLIGGTAYTIKGGRTLIGGTGYDLSKGRTLIGGTGYDISFGVQPLIVYDGGDTVLVGEMKLQTGVGQGGVSQITDNNNNYSYSGVDSNGLWLGGNVSIGPTFAIVMLGVITIGALDFTKYSTLNCYARSSDSYNGTSVLFGTAAGFTTIEQGLSTVRLTGSAQQISVDVSGITGDRYIRIQAGSTGGYHPIITKIWLE